MSVTKGGTCGVQALIVAAGEGTRFGRPKALVPLAGRPLVAWSVALFREVGAERVAVVGRSEDLPELAEALGPEVPLAPGGATRAESVRRGADLLRAGDVVLVHDAARPLASAALVARLLAADADVAVPAVAVEDTLRAAAGPPHPDRRAVLRVQTPQSFRWPAFAAVVASRREASDEAQIAEELGYAVRVVEGERWNLKVTWPEDLALAEALLASAAPLRVGHGFDVHRLVAGRRLVLAGVTLPAEAAEGRGLLGHSDADVVLHAVMDACLGAAGLADIGTFFPPEDERLRDADSTGLLADVLRHVAEAGWRPASVDVTVVAERPRLKAYKDPMRRRLAELLGIPPSAVGLKATTAEGLGALGRQEGIAAHAVAVLRPLGAVSRDGRR